MVRGGLQVVTGGYKGLQGVTRGDKGFRGLQEVKIEPLWRINLRNTLRHWGV